MVDTMQAARIHQYGGVDVVQIEVIPVPKPKPDEVLVRIRAAGLNPVDWAIRQGYLQGALSLPLTLGFDLAGEIAEVGSDITDLHVGDAVYAMMHFGDGVFAEYAVLKRDEVAKKPAALNFVQAASVPMGALTAWQALVETAKVQAGQKVLVHAAAGGVGAFAVQFAKEQGAYVIGTASAANEDYVRELCADQFIDYRSTRFEDVVKDADVVLDAIGGDTLERSYGVVKRGGLVVSIAGQPTQEAANVHGIHIARIEVRPNGDQLANIAALFDAGKLKTLVSRVLPFNDVRQALEDVHSGHGRGRIVLEI